MTPATPERARAAAEAVVAKLLPAFNARDGVEDMRRIATEALAPFLAPASPSAAAGGEEAHDVPTYRLRLFIKGEGHMLPGISECYAMAEELLRRRGATP